MKSSLSFVVISLVLVAASACNQEKAPSAGGTEPATEGPETKTPPTDGIDPNFDPSRSPDDLDKNSDPGNAQASSVDERKVTYAFDQEKLTGAAGEAVVITIDHKKVTSSSSCATPAERTPVSESGYDAEATTLVVEVSSRSAVADESSDTLRPDYEVLQTFNYTCGKSPLSLTMLNMDTGHQLELSLTVHTKDSTVYAEAKPIIALNKTDGEKALSLEYPVAE